MTADHLPALTIRQPWASLIATGVKRWETRPQLMRYRGIIRIHAAAKASAMSEAGPRPWSHWSTSVYHATTARSGNEFANPLPLGAVVATARIVDSIPIVGRGNNNEGRHIFAAPEVGALKLWEADGARGDSIADQLPYGNWTPGGWAIQLDDVHAAEHRCVVCLRTRLEQFADRWAPDGWDLDPNPPAPCTFCEDGPKPIPAKGQQARPWKWRP